MSDDNGFNEHKIYITKELQSLHRKADKQGDMLTKLQVQIATLDVKLNMKSGVWGAIAGMIPASIAIIYFMTRG